MKFANAFATLIFLICVLFTPSSAKAQDDGASQVKQVPVTPEIEAAAAKAMKGCPSLGKGIIGAINKNGVYTLTGDLFGSGKVYAIIQNGNNIIICQWHRSLWRPISSVDVKIEWNYPGWKNDEKVGLDWRPEASKPFWALTLQRHPLIAVASSLDKYHQNYVVLLLDSKSERLLNTAPSYDLQPVLKYNYLVTKDASRRKAEWGATYHSQIQNNKIVVSKSWGEYGTYPHPDDSCNIATSDGVAYKIVEDNSHDGHISNWAIFKLKNKDGNDDAKNLEPFAKLSFALKDNLDTIELNDERQLEEPYLFEKLTGLPRDFYPDEEDSKLKDRIESKAKIKVTGTKEGIKLLSPGPSR